jgi:hypothetical protein
LKDICGRESKEDDSLAMDKFIRALVANNIDLKSSNMIFAWHGTEESNIDAICRRGFDPSRRRGQQYGPGEYFGITSTASYGYCKGGSFLVATLLLDGEWLSKTNAVNAYLVNNDSDFSHSFCLPLFIVNFGTPKEAPFGIDCPTPFYTKHMIYDVETPSVDMKNKAS